MLREIRKRGLSLPVVLVSGHLGSLDEGRFRELGVDRVMSKLLDFEVLADLVQQQVARK